VNTLLSGFFPLLSANVYLLVSGLVLEFVRYIELIPQYHIHTASSFVGQSAL
jgi:hypothetical protein